MNRPTSYTKSDVLTMLKKGQLSMSALPTRRLSINQVIVETNNSDRINVLTAPINYYRSELVNSLLHSFTLPDYAVKIGIGEKSRRNKSIELFFSFLENHLQRPSKESHTSDSDRINLPPNYFRAWSEHLLETFNEKTTWRHLAYTLKILSKTLISQYTKISKVPDDLKSLWMSLKSVTPTKPEHEKSPPLGIYLGIPSSEFSEHEIYMGMRYGVIWLLKRLQTQRDQLLSIPKIIDTIESSRNTLLEDYINAHKWPKNGSFTNSPKTAQLLAPNIFQQILDDPLLLEWQTYQIDRLRPALDETRNTGLQPLSPEEQNTLLSRFISGDGSIKFRPKGYGRNDKEWAPLKKYIGSPSVSGVRLTRPCWWGTDLLIHTGFERLLMVWLLSTERAQSSGIEKLLIKDVYVDEIASRSLQISTLKLRRRSNSTTNLRNVEVETQIYTRRDSPFSDYLDWIRVEKNSKEFFTSYNLEGKFITPPGHQISGTLVPSRIRNITRGYLPLELLSVTGTTWQKTFLKESDNSRESQAFIAILSNRISKTRNRAISKTVSIPPLNIGESLVVKKEAANNGLDSLLDIESEAMGHSMSTGRNVYKDGYSAIGVGDIVEPIRAFSRKVLDDQAIVKRENSRLKLEIDELHDTVARLQKRCRENEETISQLWGKNKT